MSAYNPPVENTPIFNSGLFSVAQTTTGLTTAQADLLYLKYPTAQGAEALQAVSVSGTASFTNVAPPTSTATQPSASDSSTKIPTTAWVQTAIAQYLQPITRSSTSALAFYPPTALHLKATGYIIGRGGSAGTPATPDSGTWTMGGAGGGAGGVSFVMTFANNTQYVYFSLNYISSGQSALSWNSSSPDAGNTFGVASAGGNGADANVGAGGGSGGSGSWSSGLIPLTTTFSVVNGTSGGSGTNFDGQTIPYPASGTNSLNTSYGYGQRGQALLGYNTSGYINEPATPTGSPVCIIVWSVPAFS